MGVMHFDFMSDKLGYQTNIYVTLPECMERGEAPKGILYLLHGGGGNGLDWIRNTAIERYAQPYELAVIMPEVDGSCFYADMKHGYPYFQYLTREVPAAMEGMLPLLRGVEKRYVAGLSMGGYGAFKWAFNEPEYFMAAANLSGVSFVVDLMADDSHGLNGKESLIECNWGSLEELKGSDSDSKEWIDRAVAGDVKLPKLFAGMGTEDFSYDFSTEYLAYAAKKGIEIHYEEMPGGHDWPVWDTMIQKFMAFATQ